MSASYPRSRHRAPAPNVTSNLTVKNDVIDLAHIEFADFAAMQADLHAIGNSVVLPLDATDPITLTDLQIQNLHAQNFHFF